MNLRPEYFIRPERCLQCGRCLAACPAGAIRLPEVGGPRIDKASCRRCGACRKACRQRAIASRVRLQC